MAGPVWGFALTIDLMLAYISTIAGCRFVSACG
jgi:hypothetical protein